MSLIQVQNLSFSYPGAEQPLLDGVTLELDTRWRLGLVGRNGRGKTTFLKLLLGQLEYNGSIVASEQFEYFPVQPKDQQDKALYVARRTIAPFDAWEAQMATLAAAGTEAAMAEYGEIEQAYAAADGYIIDESIAAEAGRLGITQEALERPFASLSGGEQVKLLLAALFFEKAPVFADRRADRPPGCGGPQAGGAMAGRQKRVYPCKPRPGVFGRGGGPHTLHQPGRY